MIAELLLVVQDLLGNGVPRERRLVAGRVDLILGKGGLVLFKRALRLEQRGLVLASVKVEQRVALLDELAFLKVDRDHVAGHLVDDGRGEDRGHRAKLLQINADVTLLRRDGHDGHRPELPVRVLCRCRFLVF